MHTTPPQPSQSIWARLGAWIDALEPPSPADEAERLRKRVTALEQEIALLRTARQDTAKS